MVIASCCNLNFHLNQTLLPNVFELSVPDLCYNWKQLPLLESVCRFYVFLLNQNDFLNLSVLPRVPVVPNLLLLFPVPGSLFSAFYNKKVLNVIKTLPNVSRLKCLSLCPVTVGCYAVNVGNHGNSVCEFSSGLSSEQEMLGDTNYDVFVIRKYTGVTRLVRTRLIQIFTLLRSVY